MDPKQTSQASSSSSLFSIGYGDRPWSEFLARLKRHDIKYLVDVRSRPVSRQTEFNRRPLKALLAVEDIRYVFLGKQLGGMPVDSDCYVDGKVDYEICRQKEFFREGLSRLTKAYSGGHRVVLMCSELDPERCHRSKMIGEALVDQDIEIQHIGRDGTIITHQQVIDKLTSKQASFSFHKGFRSEGRYRPGGQRVS